MKEEQQNEKAANNAFAIITSLFEGETAEEVKVADSSLEAEQETSAEPVVKKSAKNKQELAEESSEPEDLPKEEVRDDVKQELSIVKKALEDSKAWGHRKNSTLVNAKKKMEQFLGKLQENDVILEDEVKEALSFFNLADEEAGASQTQEAGGMHPFASLKQTLDKEFILFKKYSKTAEADEKYNAFFSFLTLNPPEEQEKILTYLQEESPEIVIDHIMSTGSELYEDLYKGLTEKGGILPYVKSLKAQVEKLGRKNKELMTELDNTTEKVYARSINSKASGPSSVKKNSTSAEEIFCS